jgi:glycosyltransferase involved in cell wall biosynthesis
MAYCAKVLLNCRIIYDSHELWSGSVHTKGKKKLLYKIGCKIEKFLINKANIVITVNKSIAEILMRENNIATVNVLRNMPYKSTNNKMANKIESGFPNCKFNLIYTGNVEKGRGISSIIEAFKFVHPDVGLAIMGRNSDYRNKMIELVKSLKLENRIKFISAVLPDEVVSYCKLADTGIAPIKNICTSYYLSLPNKIFEYIQAGIPVMSSNFPEMKQVIDKYNIGNTFDVEDESNIAEAINTLHNDVESYKIYCNNSKYAAEYLNWDAEQSKLIDCYEQLFL